MESFKLHALKWFSETLKGKFNPLIGKVKIPFFFRAWTIVCLTYTVIHLLHAVLDHCFRFKSWLENAQIVKSYLPAPFLWDEARSICYLTPVQHRESSNLPPAASAGRKRKTHNSIIHFWSILWREKNETRNWTRCLNLNNYREWKSKWKNHSTTMKFLRSQLLWVYVSLRACNTDWMWTRKWKCKLRWYTVKIIPF